jgi:leucyl-tRNA synthetase
MHLLYARFWTKVLHDLGFVPFVEPFRRLRNQGMILAPDGKEKMSKSKGTVITPDEMIEQFGADALRAYEMFISDFEMATPWNTNGLAGTYCWLRRVCEILINPSSVPETGADFEPADRFRRWTHKTIGRFPKTSTVRLQHSDLLLMEFTNAIYDARDTSDFAKRIEDTLLLLLAPSHLSWQKKFGHLKGEPTQFISKTASNIL